MKKSFKILAIFLSLGLLTSLVSCQKASELPQTPQTTTQTQQQSNQPITQEREKMEYFKNYVSNTLAGTSNQLYFDNSAAKGNSSEGMMFYRATVGGEFEYSLLFSNSIDSTHSKGNSGRPNMKMNDFDIISVQLGVLDGKKTPDPKNVDAQTTLYTTSVKKYEHTNKVTYFETEPVKLNAAADDYIVAIVEFVGSKVPCHVETLIPTFKKDGNSWKADKNIPLANMVGIKREVKATVAYLGDSITQGIGVGANQYTFWNAVVSKKLGNDFSYWNLGIGYARCKDAATDGSWLFKAKQADYVVVCLGVNDIGTEKSDGPTLCSHIEKVVDELNKAGCKVILQTIPPYTSYSAEGIQTWYTANDYIKNELSKKVVAVFDQTEILMTEEKIPNQVLYGGHPNKLGCKLWGEALYEFLIANVEDFKVN